MAESSSHSRESPLTIADWTAAQAGSNGLQRLRALVQAQRATNAETHAWISLATDKQLEEQWNTLQSRGDAAKSLPLYGVPFAAKDNIDALGFPTTAACPDFSSTPATSDSSVVAKLKASGAIIIGKTNLDQFATGLVGTRSPYGPVPNSFDPTRVSGGSSSGSSVVVARGVVPFSLGTDTAGSGRVPAGLNNIVGLKPTRGALSVRGSVPACRTLDCISIFALTIGDAEAVLSVAEGYDEEDSYSRSRPNESVDRAPGGFGSRVCMSRPSLAICSQPEWFGREDHQPAYEKALEKARSLGWTLVPVNFESLFRLAYLLYSGPWIAERYQAMRSFIQTQPENMDPVVRGIVQKADNFTAADAFESEYARQDLTREIERAFKSFDGLLVPTSPTFPTMSQIADAPVLENSRLGTYTNFVNFLDWSALSVPAGFRPDGLPFGITLISNHWRESQLLSWGREWLSGQVRSLGATGIEITEPPSDLPALLPGHVHIAVVGAHLSGFPLNKDLLSRNASFSKTTTTSPHYRLYALKSVSGPKKPGLRRVTEGQGFRIEVEVWNLPEISFASFLESIPSPLGLGKVELSDGTWVTSFICEPYGLQNATDITSYGGWRAYQSSVKGAPSPSKRSISTVLIANRGEIAVRIINTLHKMGLTAVAIYSDTDADAPHVRNADVSIKLNGSSVAETYLDVPQIIDLAKSKGVDAVIPGYGFLSENSDFAMAVEEAGMTWVGPTPEHMSVLGLKHRARDVAIAADVPTIPGSRGLLTDLEHALSEADRIGYPLMLKSTAGGGGIGLSQCTDAASLKSVYYNVQRQAAANFGDGGAFLERFVKRARHIEVQILGDGTGRVIAAGERDCSLQRRNQKVVEESPAALVPDDVRERMRAAAIRLASYVKYANVGTVEFIYDIDSQEFYFLEVNTRLQVEHPVTELVTGLDLVKCMIDIADSKGGYLFTDTARSLPVSGASVEVRIYAESPLEQFRPCSGKITKLEFPTAPNIRVDTWVEEGTKVTTSYDPMLAKLIAFGRDRGEALQSLSRALMATTIEGVQTNLEYVRQIVASDLFAAGEFTTKSLDSFKFISPSFEVLEPGTLTTVQDFPGRTGYWSVGIPPSGPADNLSFRLANRLVENAQDSAALECTLQGPSLRFHCETVIAVAGANAPVTLDNEDLNIHQSHHVQPGQVLRIGTVSSGYRVYLAIKGGIQVPKVFGSRSTLELGKMGGFKGRKLRARDILPLTFLPSKKASFSSLAADPAPIPSQAHAEWTVRVTGGPHGAPDHFTVESMATLFSSPWKVHHNSNRLGVRLEGPSPKWARTTGGEAGLHPSNIHDSPYSVGSVSFTGDEAVVLTCDGPSLGGFVVFCVVASADLWKMGQVRPGDTIYFQVIDVDAALALDKELDRAIESLGPLPSGSKYDVAAMARQAAEESVVLATVEKPEYSISLRQCGDRALLLELGDASGFDLRHSLGILAFCRQHEEKPIQGVEELTPGVCTLHVIYSPGLTPCTMIKRIRDHLSSYATPCAVPSRTVRMPFAFDDSVCQAAVRRYAETIRDEAPWLPSNVEFLEELNGIDDIKDLMHRATFLVVGLGDVFMGSPCAVPLDPRDRLFGTKYNPSRSFTPRGAVGIGGQYLCIYATDSPGGYQLVGRTKQIWDESKVPEGRVKSAEEAPWSFRLFDRISFYPLTEEKLDSMSFADLVSIEDGELNIEEYEAMLVRDQESISSYKSSRSKAIAEVPFLDQLTQPFRPRKDSKTSASRDVDTLGERVKALMPGRCYKVNVKEGDRVKKGDVLVCVESSKMEVGLESPATGRCAAVLVEAGDLVDTNDDLIILVTDE